MILSSIISESNSIFFYSTTRLYHFFLIFRFYKPLAIIICFILPTVIPPLLWNESYTIAYFIPAVLRYIVTLHVTWLVNSLAHLVGNKPYDKRINPAQNLLVSFFALGEGFHNYHHTFPQG